MQLASDLATPHFQTHQQALAGPLDTDQPRLVSEVFNQRLDNLVKLNSKNGSSMHCTISSISQWKAFGKHLESIC